MRCIACGREMVNRGTHFECPNMLCDYEETTDTEEVLVESCHGLPIVVYEKSMTTPVRLGSEMSVLRSVLFLHDLPAFG